MQKMATNKTPNKSPVFKMGQLWHTINDNMTADEDDGQYTNQFISLNDFFI